MNWQTAPVEGIGPNELAPLIQHTNVRPEATRADVERLVSECVEHGLGAAMVNPIWVPVAARLLSGTSIQVCTALDFPMAGGTTASVARSAAEARAAGAEQIDVMTKLGWLKAGMEAEYRDHLAAVVREVDGAPVKAMLEVALLSQPELERSVELCADAGVRYVKNSSGYGGGDATPAIVARLVALCGNRMGVKASGGVRTFRAARALVAAGASLLGSSAGPAIVSGEGSNHPSRGTDY